MDQTNPNNSMNIILKKYKVVMLGDQSVGKTSIIKAYSDEGFNPDNDVRFADDSRPSVSISKCG
jgi:GTPase SAR1 family protein